MAEFERGDVVVYENPECPEYVAMGIVTKVEDETWPGYPVWVESIVNNDICTPVMEMNTPWKAHVWRKVGHIDLPPEVHGE